MTQQAYTGTLDASVVDSLARELVDPDTPEFSIAIGAADYARVLERADEIEGGHA